MNEWPRARIAASMRTFDGEGPYGARFDPDVFVLLPVHVCAVRAFGRTGWYTRTNWFAIRTSTKFPLRLMSPSTITSRLLAIVRLLEYSPCTKTSAHPAGSS